MTESKIKVVLYAARDILFHVRRKSSSIITTILWTYAIYVIVEWHNMLSLDWGGEGAKPIRKICWYWRHHQSYWFPYPRIPCLYPGGLKSLWRLRNSKGGGYISYWKCVGHYPCHTGSITLVFNLTFGLGNPKYHVIYNDKFSTVPYLESITLQPNWKELKKKH